MRQLRDIELTSTLKWLNLLADFWLWWSNELAGLIPSWMKYSSTRTTGDVKVEFRDSTIFMSRKVKGKDDLSREYVISDDASIPDDLLYQPGDKVSLVLADGLYLKKKISLPIAAAENLGGVLEFEMDRHTPFQASQVYFDFHTISRSNATQQLVLELIAAPKKTVDGLLETLLKFNMPVSVITIESSEGIPNINMIARKPDTGSKFIFKSRLTNFHISVLIVTLFLVMATMILPIWQKRINLLQLQPIVEELGTKASSIQSSRRELAKIVAEHNFLVEKKLLKPPAIAVLEELARILPDDTWIHRVAITGDEVEVVGETSSSAAVIRLIENSRHFVNANFQSPLTKGRSGKERFHLLTEFSATASPLTEVAVK